MSMGVYKVTKEKRKFKLMRKNPFQVSTCLWMSHTLCQNDSCLLFLGWNNFETPIFNIPIIIPWIDANQKLRLQNLFPFSQFLKRISYFKISFITNLRKSFCILKLSAKVRRLLGKIVMQFLNKSIMIVLSVNYAKS